MCVTGCGVHKPMSLICVRERSTENADSKNPRFNHEFCCHHGKGAPWVEDVPSKDGATICAVGISQI
ncbi:hypothetical protein EMIT0196MI5_90144 [Pseudomonas sp. IT-196MI5]